jgi:hypothetical protein
MWYLRGRRFCSRYDAVVSCCSNEVVVLALRYVTHQGNVEVVDDDNT